MANIIQKYITNKCSIQHITCQHNKIDINAKTQYNIVKEVMHKEGKLFVLFSHILKLLR